MARARSLKPALFKNEILGTADPLYTLLFEGLWCLADREGRLEDRPLRIKVEVFPYRDGINADSMLNWLQDNQFISRYQIGDKRYIQIVNFKKHQNPHTNEQPSLIPEFGESPSDFGESARADSLNLTPDSPNPMTTTEATSVARCPVDEILKLYHEFLPMCPRVMKLTTTRERLLRARWKEHPHLDQWKQFFAIVKRSKFLTGKTNGHGDRPPFLADFEWLIRPGSFVKVMEGKYDSR